MTEPTQILTPVGRIVQGDCFKGRDTDMQGNPLTVKTGTRAGEARSEWFVALAIPKDDPGWPALQAAIHQAARAGFPTLFDAQGNCTNPNFSFKYTDGDSQVAGPTGRRPCDNEGFPGNWVLKFRSGFAPQCFSQGGKGVITDSDLIKRGYYVRISGSVVGNNSPVRPGVYLNLTMVELCGYGPEIKTGPDGAAVFGGTPAGALPPGASPTPLAAPTVPAGAGGIQVGSGGIHMKMPEGSVDRMLPNLPPAAAPPPPAPDFLNPPAGKLYTLGDGKQYTAEQLLAAGWTQAQIDALDR